MRRVECQRGMQRPRHVALHRRAGSENDGAVLVGDADPTDLPHTLDPMAQQVVHHRGMRLGAGRQLPQGIDRVAQDEVDRFGGAAGLLGKHHVQAGHLPFGVGDRGVADTDELLRRGSSDQQSDRDCRDLQRTADRWQVTSLPPRLAFHRQCGSD